MQSLILLRKNSQEVYNKNKRQGTNSKKCTKEQANWCLQKALHPGDGISKVNALGKKENKGLTNTEVSVDALTQGLEDYIRKREDRSITSSNCSHPYIRIDR